MEKKVKALFCFSTIIFALFLCISPARGVEPAMPLCAEGTQSPFSDSEYRICMPQEVPYNGRFIIWAHGFQDAGTPVEIPEGQLCFDDNCIPDLVLEMGFGFATNSYRKTGLAVIDGMADIIDLVENLVEYSEVCEAGSCMHIVHDPPEVIYLIGASEGGHIAALLAEQHSEIFDAAYALCAPIGDFPYQINYLGDARVTFEYFFPNKIPGYNVFNNIDTVDGRYIRADDWDDYFMNTVGPLLASKLWKLRQWAKVAKLPFDPNDWFDTVLFSAKEALRFSVVYPNLDDAVTVLDGLPFDNRWKWYTGSNNDFRLNLRVKRLAPTGSAVNEMQTYYNTSGDLYIPLITMHTLLDPQVPYFHETLYNLKTIVTGSFLADHYNIPIDRYGHCNFTLDEAMGGFALMLLYAGDWEIFSALEASLEAQ